MKRPLLFFRMLYQVVLRVFAVPYALVLRVHYHGIRNIPKRGPFIVCANHRSVLDPVTVAAAFRQHIYFMAKRELFTDHGAFAAGVITVLGAFPVQRDKADLQSLRNALRVLRRGDVLGIFAQGRVQFDNAPFRPKAGTVLLAAKAGVPIVPVSIFCEGAWRFGKCVTVRIGKPLPASAFKNASHDHKQLRSGTALLASTINRQLEEGH